MESEEIQLVRIKSTAILSSSAKFVNIVFKKKIMQKMNYSV